MYQLNEQQIDYILNDIGARGVEMESLQQNLLDHICCIIENNLEENGDFESFYKKTIQTFYKDALWEIEEETLQLLTNKNYYKMKKIMIYSGTLSVAGFIAGSIFKIMHWPGASAILLLSMLNISLIFLPLLFILKTREVSAMKDKLMIAIGTIFGILFSTSSLFKIFHWPGANLMWLFALGILMFVFIPIYFFSGIRTPETKVNTIITSIILISAGGMLFTLTSLKPSTKFYIGKTYNYLQGEELITRMQLIKNDTTNQNPEMINISKEILENCKKIKEIIIIDGIGIKSIPKDFETKDIILQESGLGKEFDPAASGMEMIQKLKKQINSYNTLVNRNKQLPIDNNIERMEKMELIRISNYNLLNSLTEIQLFILQNEKGLMLN
ncbi:MAG: hypothetical protein K9H41_09780 [Bacteroidia bacterium]|nr:hypothetical protein [Bacteroidia bacterium]